jgi:hypothetical protein
MRYATALDTRDWDLFRTGFTDDCVCDYGQVGSWRGLEEFTAFMERAHARCGDSLHRVTNLVMRRDGDDVMCTSYVDALVLGPGNASGTRIAGRYEDRLTRASGSWRIARRVYTTTYISTVSQG